MEKSNAKKGENKPNAKKGKNKPNKVKIWFNEQTPPTNHKI